MHIVFSMTGVQDAVNLLSKATDIPALERFGETLLDEVSEAILKRTQEFYLKELDPEGSAWEPSRAAQLRKSKGGGGTLYDTGTLFNSIDWTKETPMKRILGTNVKYGKYHQFGTSKLPVREFLSFSTADVEMIEDKGNERLLNYLGL